VPPTPALVPLVTAEAWSRELPGLVLPQARVQLDARGGGRGGPCGPVLFTHDGLSGPPVLDLSGEVASRLCDGPVALRLAVRADRDRAAWLALFESWRTSRGGRSMHHLLAAEIPRRLAETICGLAGLAATAAARASRARLEALAGLCAGATLTVTATKGWPQAMVTRGGVALEELDPRDLGCRRLPGLRCAGEIVDLDGPCGGYNLTWAFASGWLAGSRP
jgi:predicted Rossmann fold flavoprotein